MLEDCTALIATGSTAERDELAGLAEALGFGTILRAGENRGARPAGPITFFFVHHNDPPDRKKTMLQALRRSRDDNVRFAPAIIAGQKLTAETIRHYVSEGFDDVLSLPMETEAVRERLAEQLGTTRDYFETRTYFGPDRRRNDPTLRVGSTGYVLWRFQRNPLAGISVHLARMAGPPLAARPTEWMRVPAY